MSVELLFDSDFIESLLYRTGQDGHAQDRHLICASRSRGANHFRSAAEMNGKHLHAKVACRFNCSRDGVWNVVQFQVEKDLRAAYSHSLHNLRSLRGIKLQSDFEKRDLLAQLLD